MAAPDARRTGRPKVLAGCLFMLLCESLFKAGKPARARRDNSLMNGFRKRKVGRPSAGFVAPVALRPRADQSSPDHRRGDQP
jgi:hypothetical protein